MNTRKILIPAAAAILIVIAGCASSNSRTEAAFGDAVRQVNKAQIYDPNAAENPDPAPVLGGDPERLNNTLSGHRKDVASPKSVNAPITINVGDSGSQQQ